MSITFELVRDLPGDVSAVLIPACSDQLGEPDATEAHAPDATLPPEADWGYLRARGFEGKVDQVAALPGRNRSVLFLVGLGPSASVDTSVIRRAAAVAARAAFRHALVGSYLLDAVSDAAAKASAAQAMAEGVCLGSYQYNAYRSNPEPNVIERMVVVSTGGKRVREALELGASLASGASLARDLVNEPGGELTPPVIAERVAALADECGFECTVWDEAMIEAERLGGLLGVNRGSSQPPRFVQLRYAPEGKPRGRLALVGKGITFDSGGLSIKSSSGMMTMKDDMAGAAAVIGAFSVLGTVAPKCEVLGYLPFTDNMSDGDATRPGDVLRMRSGKTVEVLNTDAEGRLVLADALSLASEIEPDAIVDIATLTGAVETALGSRIAGLMGRDRSHGAGSERGHGAGSLSDQVAVAAERSGEKVWPLPLPAEYRKSLESDVADLRNIGKIAAGGALTAGLFLQEFVGDGIPWAHIDIAGAAWSTDADGELAKGGTGFGVRLLVELIRRFKRPPKPT